MSHQKRYNFPWDVSHLNIPNENISELLHCMRSFTSFSWLQLCAFFLRYIHFILINCSFINHFVLQFCVTNTFKRVLTTRENVLPFKEHLISWEINSSILNISCVRCNPLALSLPDFLYNAGSYEVQTSEHRDPCIVRELSPLLFVYKSFFVDTFF